MESVELVELFVPLAFVRTSFTAPSGTGPLEFETTGASFTVSSTLSTVVLCTVWVLLSADDIVWPLSEVVCVRQL